MASRKSSKIENRKSKIPRRFTAPVPHLRKDSTQQSAIRPNPKSKIQNPKSAGDLLLEIGTEELPAAYLPDLINQLGREAKALLESNHLSFGEVKTFGTPRRLVLLVRSLSGIQRKPAEEVRGPSKQACYDKDGKPTPALLGFLRSRNGTIEQTKLVDSEKGAYVYLIKPPTEVPTAQLLPEWLAQCVTLLRAPKTMRWDASGVRFARPIRWLLALYGTKPVRMTLGALRSQTQTRVGGPLGTKRLAVTSVDGYFSLMKREGVVIDHQQRRVRIEQDVERIAKRAGGTVAPEMIGYGLLDEVTFLVEKPVTLNGSFDPTYLALPREVLLASMAKHQRVFAIESKGALLPRWIAVLEGKPGKPDAVRAVIERILNARLADSLLFWNEDRKRPLDQMAAALSGVTFHEKIGSMEQKTRRLTRLARVLAEAWRLNDQARHQLERACLLAKADLVTTMVREFPTLQGIMGKRYALASGEAQPVADAIEEHYLPLAGKAPKTLLGSALAILDKYDTLAGYFSIGIEPTGDQDPFGLRRAAQGIVEVIWASRRPFRFESMYNAWQASVSFAHGKANVAERVKRYLLERLYTFEWPDLAPSSEHINAVLASPCDDLLDVMNRIVALQRFHGDDGLVKAAKVIERTGNILKGAPATSHNGVDPALLQEPLERELYTLYESKKEEFIRLVEGKSYAEATALFGETFYAPLHDFFDKVLVNVENESVRRNRLALMSAIRTLYTGRIADLSKLTLPQQKERA